MPGPPRSLVAISLAAVIVLAATRALESGAYIFAGDANGLDSITHPQGYTGTGGPLNISVAIDPMSANASAMEISVQNIVNTFNGLVATTGNLVIGGGNNIPSNAFDFESIALHELGHSLGLAHPNAASESGLIDSDRNYTKATNGVDNVFNLNDGADNVIGSSDDIRGDDVNLHWFRTSNNNPFTIEGTVDGTTYSRDSANLPSGHTFATNADRDVSALLGVSNTEAVMQQGTNFDEAQRTLTHDDVATLRIGSGTRRNGGDVGRLYAQPHLRRPDDQRQHRPQLRHQRRIGLVELEWVLHLPHRPRADRHDIDSVHQPGHVVLQ